MKHRTLNCSSKSPSHSFDPYQQASPSSGTGSKNQQQESVELGYSYLRRGDYENITVICFGNVAAYFKSYKITLRDVSICTLFDWHANAGAVALTWNLGEVTFMDGGYAYGSFDYDAGTNTY